MRDVSDLFLEAIRRSAKARFEARVCTTYQTGTNPTGTDIPILGGDVQMDGTADVRATLDMTTGWDWAAETRVDFPADGDDLLTPYGNEIFVRRGIELGDRSVEWVSLGYFRIWTVTQPGKAKDPIRIAARDRMSGIADAKPLQPIQFLASTTVEQVFEQLIEEVYPSATVEFDFDAAGTTIGTNNIVEDSRYEFLRDLAAAHAKDFYVDHRGIFVVKSRPDIEDPVWTVDSGEEGVLISTNREISREKAFNAVVATGESADNDEPVIGIAKDMDPSSPTYWNGTFGKVPDFMSTPLLVTAGQCRDAAKKRLQDNLGVPFSLDFTARPNPALEPYDPIHVQMPGHSYIHTLQSITIPLTASQPLTATTRDQTSIAIGLT